ncbi:LacI family DNA-binding transcriptional regulator [Propionimicrobium sp. PCR01-08-3]|uniref:LacI family DNA-binding transcriptional regulator n=1 Tax=Propionimicrobium sp. PCR01-08-3 TaxID=3052086 RepID=UPI00255CD9AA|nr:LacI family DNA-binding transcriptional regulator [Propionimicrobium sp. PCR01-08-3]WIY82858.1 LacI family DNA-binding transcriptional regulator [Propionimicrobium sp. PCR01-08-3]
MNDKVATIRDVAARAGVGVKTVSRVINNEPHVAAATRQRVLSAIDELDYRPNAAGQGLRRAVAGTIAFVCEDTSEAFSQAVASSIESAAGQRSAFVTASTRGDSARERELLESLIARNVNGIVLAPSRGDLGYLKHRHGHTAIVCVDRPAAGFTADLAMSDNEAGMARATELLVGRGHRRIAYFGDSARLVTQRERLAGYLAVLDANGLRADHTLVYQHSPDVERVRRQLAYLAKLPEPPAAVVSANSLTTLDLIHAGLPVDSGGFVAFDDFPLADVVLGGITCVVQDARAIGEAAAGLLFRRMTGDRSEARVVRVPTKLIERSIASPDQVRWTNRIAAR